MNKPTIIGQTDELFQEVFASGKGGIQVMERGACLYYTACLMYVANAHGVRLVPQAGSAAWPCVDFPFPLNGNTHFAYQWQGIHHPTVVSRIEKGLMPEMHVWAGCIETQEIVDVTTRYLPAQCELQAGIAWLAPEPPRFFWGKGQDMPAHWVYSPKRDATEMIESDIRESLERIDLVVRGFTITNSLGGGMITAKRETK
jgi:hypothetical protein